MTADEIEKMLEEGISEEEWERMPSSLQVQIDYWKEYKKDLESGDRVDCNGLCYYLMKADPWETYEDTPEEIFGGTYGVTYCLERVSPRLDTLDNFEIPNEINGKKVTRVGYKFSFNWRCVKSINIPESVVYIEQSWLSKLTDGSVKITIDPKNRVYNLDGDWLNITLPANYEANIVEEKDKLAPKFVSFTDNISHFIGDKVSVSVAPDNPYYKSIDGAVYSKDGKTLLFANDRRSLFEIKEGVTTIARNAMILYHSFKEVIIPSSVKNIGYGAFNCSHEAALYYEGYLGCRIFYKGTKADWEKINIDKTYSPGRQEYSRTNTNTELVDYINANDWQNFLYFYSEKPTLGTSWHYAADGVTPEIRWGIFDKRKPKKK